MQNLVTVPIADQYNPAARGITLCETAVRFLPTVFTVHGNIEHLRQQTKQRWQLVGHGRDNQLDGEHVSLAWR